MEEFFGFTVEKNGKERNYRCFYDIKKVRFEEENGPGVVEFTFDDPSYILESDQVPVEDIEQLSFFLRDNQDIMQARLRGEWIDLPEDMDKLFQTPKWLSLPWVNLSQICQMLYGKKDKSTTAYFALKRQGKRPWKVAELEKLEAIRKQMIHQVQEG